ADLEDVAAPAPLLADLDEALPDRDRESYRPGCMVLLELRIVEEHHQAVAGEVLERALLLHDQPADGGVIAPEEPEDLFGFGRLRERREVAEITEHRGDLAAVTRPHRLAVCT